MLLEINNVGKRFSGLQALRDVTLVIPGGRIYGLIGPNGAGKTTLFNVITGALPATTGSIRFEGRNISGLAPHKIARCGIARTYQLVRPFSELNVQENVEVGVLFGRKRSLPTSADRHLEANKYIMRASLAHKALYPVNALNLGERKRLEIAKALASSPKLILFDEVLAGLNPTETVQAIEFFQAICADGITILMIEHNMQAIMRACDHIFVLHHGELIGQGTPQQVSTDAKVIEAYLGGKDLRLERRRRVTLNA
jgi:branched-chain amino acid transport system ATP-binding protein